MAKVVSTNLFAVAPAGSSAPDSITSGGGSIWVEYGNGADSTGAGGSSTVVQYSSMGQIEQTYTITGLADGLKYDATTGDVWALLNNDGNSQLVLIDPATNQVSAPLSYAAPYVYGANSPAASTMSYSMATRFSSAKPIRQIRAIPSWYD
jgi:hypothetical protein